MALSYAPPPLPSGLQPAGRRWGRGARTVLPYLSPAIQAKLLAADIALLEDGPIRNPVFPTMDWATPAESAGAPHASRPGS